MTLKIRPAVPADQPHILALARHERVKPVGLKWPKFIVAEHDQKIVGAVQLRDHPDGSRELGSLVVAAAFRGRGVAAQLINRRLEGAAGPVFVIAGRTHADYYTRWGFRRIKPIESPTFVCMNYWIGYIGGGLMAAFRGRAVNHLAVLERQQHRGSQPRSIY